MQRWREFQKPRQAQFHVKEDDHAYVNVSITNDIVIDPLVSQPNTPARIQLEYEQTIIDNPEEYYATIVKFQIPLDSLPLFIMPIVPNQANPLLTPLRVGVFEVEDPATIIPPSPNPPLTPGGESPVIYQPTDWGNQAPVQNQPFQVISDFYYVYSYTRLIKMINLALLDAWTNEGSPGGAGNQPYFIYDPRQGKISLVLPYEFVTAASVTGFGWSVYVNEELLNYLQSFDFNFNRGRWEIDTQELTYDKSAIAEAPIGNGTAAAGGAYIIEQDFDSFDYINSPTKLLITTNTIPVKKEQFPVPRLGNEQARFNSFGILSEYDLDLTGKPGQQRGILKYDADLYRLVDLYSTQPLRKIDLTLYWVDQNNNIYPLFVSPFNSMQIKIGFIRRDVVKGEIIKLE